MSRARKPQVLVLVHDWTADTRRCLNSILDRSGSVLERLSIMNCEEPRPGGRIIGSSWGREDPRVQIVGYPAGGREVEAWNSELRKHESDIVLMRSDLEVSEGWLEELAEVAHSEERIFCSVPLINQIGYCSVPYDESTDPLLIDGSDVRTACTGLPRSTTIPAVSLACCYIRGDLLEAVGLLDARYAMTGPAVIDWVMKAQALGFFVKRANHVFVQQVGSGRRNATETGLVKQERAQLSARHPQLQPQLNQFQPTLDCTLAYHAIHLRASNRVRVAYDLRSLPPEQVGTRTYAVSLAKALSEIPEIDLTLVVRKPEQAHGLAGRVVTLETWKNDVEVIHRPMQLGRGDLHFLLDSSAHLVVTYQDLIGYRIPQVFVTDEAFQSYQEASRLSLQVAQRILVYSESTAQEIVEEFKIPRDEVVAVALGVDVEWFSRKGSGDAKTVERLSLPGRYFFSVATDYPHKNLPCLLDAYARFRATWSEGECPALVLAGHSTASRGGLYQWGQSAFHSEGVRFLGPVSADELRILYQASEALIFPSLYEGFGLPPLEAMAAGTAVIAMPISSIPEVAADGVLYPQGLSAESLAGAMDHLASDHRLRSRLCEKGRRRVRQFSWADTARKTLEVYRSAVLQPSDRSLAMRRQLRETILTWSNPIPHYPMTIGMPSSPAQAEPEFIGMRTAWRELNGAFHRRLRREVKRFLPITPSRSA